MPEPKPPQGLHTFQRSVMLNRLTPGEPYSFSEVADTAESVSIATHLEALSVKKLRFDGILEPVGKRDWRLRGNLGATVSQPCVVTLEPVTTRIDTDVNRLYSASAAPVPDGAELGPEDDINIEPLPAALDLGEIAVEEIALALPAYPKRPEAELPNAATDPADPGPETRENPFAALAALRDKMEKPED